MPKFWGKTASLERPAPRSEKPPTVQEVLAERGVHPSQQFGDYQDYIEQQQEKLPTKLVREERVPVEGSVHLSLGRLIRVFR